MNILPFLNTDNRVWNTVFKKCFSLLTSPLREWLVVLLHSEGSVYSKKNIIIMKENKCTWVLLNPPCAVIGGHQRKKKQNICSLLSAISAIIDNREIRKERTFSYGRSTHTFVYCTVSDSSFLYRDLWELYIFTRFRRLGLNFLIF